MDVLHAATNYTLRLPMEMLDEIAEQVVSGDSIAEWEDLVLARCTLASVSHLWNDVVGSNTQLWNNISIFRNSKSTYIATCFQRANTANIHLHIDCSPRSYLLPDGRRVEYTLAAFARGKLPLLSAEFSEVHSLSIVAPSRDAMAAVLRSCSEFADLTNLKSVSTSVVTGVGASVDPMPWFGSTTCPQVLHVAAMAPSWTPSYAFRNLRVLRLVDVDAAMEYAWSHLCSVLYECRGNLTTLQLRSVHCVGFTEQEPLTLPAMEVFELATKKDDWAHRLRRFSMPAIVTLTVHVSEESSLYALYHSNPCLFTRAKYLRFGVPTAKLHELRSVLPLLRGVQTLDMWDCEPGMAWFLGGLLLDPDFDLSHAVAIRVRDVLTTSLVQSIITSSAPGCVVTSGSAYGSTGSGVEWRVRRGLLTTMDF